MAPWAEIAEADVQFAAGIAAHHSKARGEEEAPVMYCVNDFVIFRTTPPARGPQKAGTRDDRLKPYRNDYAEQLVSDKTRKPMIAFNRTDFVKRCRQVEQAPVMYCRADQVRKAQGDPQGMVRISGLRRQLCVRPGERVGDSQ